ncbi:sodium/potassium-transporting ATPase subunit beta-3 [Gracilinanus agilis]|uniref:sodium/potassium-transporting ATPase subunit beta-3 n=1 Tax=Gracilinanus agilis TaxID=191870 RepID=UPI001CFDB8E8|nr:sodium/potassium-transporting ATPase subunit beta-3 [Gracilinanus agilis]
MSKDDKKDEQEDSWRNFIYNSETSEFLGRTVESWSLILLFYLVFYGFLAALFSFMMWVMLQTLNEETPKYRDLISSPGLSIVPRPTNALEILVNTSEKTSYEHYVTAVGHFLKRYEDSMQEKNLDCESGIFFEQKSKSKLACKFSLKLLELCSGMNDTSFGFDEGSPCIILKMNRIIGLKPEGNPYIQCSVKEENVTLRTFPQTGKLDLMYFPYYGKKMQKDYLQPLVALKVSFEDGSEEASIECKVEGSPNLKNEDERDKFLGHIAFKVMLAH